jgi:hypothetical protein
MATATATIHAFVTLETAHAHAYGDAFDVAKAEIDALERIDQARQGRAYLDARACDRSRLCDAQRDLDRGTRGQGSLQAPLHLGRALITCGPVVHGVQSGHYLNQKG